MPTSLDPSQALLGNRALVTIDLPAMPGSPRVVGVEGHEGFSSLYEFRVEVAVDDAVDLDPVVGAPVSLLIEGLDAPRYLHGEVASVDYIGETPRHALYELLVVPSLWRLGLRHTSRIFQHKTTPEVVLEVLRRAGIKGDAVRTDLTAAYEPRSYCVQYRESDLAFIRRLTGSIAMGNPTVRIGGFPMPSGSQIAGRILESAKVQRRRRGKSDASEQGAGACPLR